jgi:carboxymethylenebutenolidase
MAAELEKALTDAHVAHRCEIYQDARHGWTMPDLPVYDRSAAERAWTELFALFERRLG